MVGFPAAMFITALKASGAAGSWACARHTLGTGILLTQTNTASVFYLSLYKHSHAHTHGNTVINTLFASVVVYFQTLDLKAMITALSREIS